LNTVQDGHRDIDHKNIRIKVENRPQGLLPISRGSYDVKVLAQLLTKVREERLTVIG
jgi:hypothetical protein